MSTDRSDNKEKGKVSATQPMPGKKPRSKHWYETAAVAIVLIIAIAGGYYGFYVSNRTDRLSDYYSRNLASAAAIVQQAIEDAWLNVCNSKFEGEKLAMIAGVKVRPGTRTGEKYQQNDPTASDDLSACSNIPTLETIAGWYQGAATLQFTDGESTAQITLLALLESALPASDFDSVLLARQNGDVLISFGSKEFNIITLPIDAESLASGDSDGDAAQETWSPGRYTTVADFDVAGTTYKLFAQPVRVPINLHRDGPPAHGAAMTNGKERATEEVWVLVGLKKHGKFLTEAMAISPTILLAAFAMAIIALLSMPYLKLRYLGHREALHTHDMLVLTSALLIGTTIATFAVLEVYARLTLDDTIDDRLNAFSTDISNAFHEEVACLSDQLERLTELRAGDSQDTRVALAGPEESVRLPTYPFLEMAYWMDGSGQQTNKWTVDDSSTTLIPVGTRQYFIAARDMRFQNASMVECPFAQGLAEPDPNDYSRPGYYLESIRSRTTGEVSTVLSQRLSGQNPESLDKEVIQTKDKQPIVAAAALAPLLSVTEPTLPPGFEFVIVDLDGDVVLHSNSTRNLRENFFDELNDGLQIQAAVWSRTTKPTGVGPAFGPTYYPLEPMDVEYRARAYRTNLTRLDGTAWTLASLYDVSSYRIARAEVLTFALALSLIYTILLIVLFAVLHAVRVGLGNSSGSIFHWLWPSEDKRDAYVGMLVFTIVAAVVWLLLELFSSPAVSVLFAGLLGLATFFACFETFRRAATESGHRGVLSGVGRRMVALLTAKSAKATSMPDPEPNDQATTPQSDSVRVESHHRLYALTVMAIIIMLSVLPPISFYRAANNEIMELFTMVDQLRWADEFHARSDRKAHRYRSVNLDAATHSAIRERLFPPSGNLGESWDTHTAGWKVCVGEKCAATWPGTRQAAGGRVNQDVDGERENCGGIHEEDRCLTQPIAAILGPDLLGIVRQSWEIRSLAHEANRRWFRHGEDVVFVDRTFDSRPGLGEKGGHARLPETLDDAGLYLASPWLGLGFPGVDPSGWIRLVLLVAAGTLALWVMIRSTARLIFLTDLRQPMFLPVRKWRDLDGYRRALVLRSSLKGEPDADGKLVFRIDAAQDLDFTHLEKLENEPASASSVVVIIDRFHVGLWDPDIAEQKLALLERLLVLDCRAVVHSDVNPLHYFTMVAGEHFRGVTQVLPDLGRWAAVLAEFPRCRDVPLDKSETDDLYRRLVAQREDAVGVRPVGEAEHDVLQRLARECWQNEHLQEIAMRLARRKDLTKLVIAGDDEHLIKQVLDQAEAHYRVLWSISGKDERMVLYRLATNGFASWRGRELVRRLLHRGLIHLNPGPTLMNDSFRQFVLTAELPEVLELWTEEEGVSPWARLRTPIMVTVTGVFLFLFATQPQLFSQSLAFTTAIAAIVPTFIKVISLVAGTRSDSSG